MYTCIHVVGFDCEVLLIVELQYPGIYNNAVFSITRDYKRNLLNHNLAEWCLFTTQSSTLHSNIIIPVQVTCTMCTYMCVMLLHNITLHLQC